METITKKCSKCGNIYPISLEYWNSQKNGKYGLRSKCKTCSCEYSKLYKSTPEAKESHRIRQAEWRKKNHDKFLEISRKSYVKNGKRYNEIRKQKYNSSEEYRQKQKDKERKYKESGKRYIVQHKPDQMEKSRLRSKKRRSIEELKEHDYKRNAVYRIKNKEYLQQLHKKTKEELRPSYIGVILGLKVKDLTPELIETTRLIVNIKRELKNNNVKIR
jgi:hypothetical protein